jgi:hypothetical protein
MAQEPRPRPLRDVIAIRLRAARLEAVLIGLVVIGAVLGVGMGMQASLASVLGNLAHTIGTVAGG